MSAFGYTRNTALLSLILCAMVPLDLCATCTEGEYYDGAVGRCSACVRAVCATRQSCRCFCVNEYPELASELNTTDCQYSSTKTPSPPTKTSTAPTKLFSLSNKTSPTEGLSDCTKPGYITLPVFAAVVTTQGVCILVLVIILVITCRKRNQTTGYQQPPQQDNQLDQELGEISHNGNRGRRGPDGTGRDEVGRG